MNAATVTTSAWEISADDFPESAMTAEKWRFLLGYALLAPSSHNSQPWLFRIHEGNLELYADRSRACRVVDPHDRELLMSCGCALFHLRAAMRHFDCLGSVRILPNPDDRDLLAQLTLGREGENSTDDGQLFAAITRRRTNRLAFRGESVPTPVLLDLRAAAEKEGALLAFAPSDDVKLRLADLIAEGDRIQWSNQDFRRELANWIHPTDGCHRDGIPGYAREFGDLMADAGPLIVRTFDLGDGIAANDHELAAGSPALGVLITEADHARDWLVAGQALARVLLRARVGHVWASFLNQPIEVRSLRSNIPHVIGAAGFPQAILRFGYGDDVRPTPRRAVEELLI
jgi:hypothetical protein